MAGDVLLTVAQVAAQLQVHPETVTRWIRQGHLEATLLSRRGGYRVRESDLERFLIDHRKTVSHPSPSR